MWWRWLIVIAGTGIVLAGLGWAELQYQPRISDAHKQQQQSAEAISDSGQQPIFPAKPFDWINDVVEWTDSHHDFVLAVATVFLAAFTLALFAATLGMLLFAKRQASEMQSLLTAAQDNAAASASQVKAIEAQERVMREQAETMAANLDLTRQAANAAQTAAEAATLQANAAKKTADVAERALIVADRPWVTVRIMIQEGNPVVFTDEWIEVTVKIIAKNIGRSPATRIAHSVRLFHDIIAAHESASQIRIRDSPCPVSAGSLNVLGSALASG